MQTEKAFLLLHLGLSAVKFSIAAPLTTFVLISKQSSVRSEISIVQAVSSIIEHLVVLIIIRHHGAHLLLQVCVAQTAEYGEAEEGQTKEEHEAKEGPFELLCENKRTEYIINLVLCPG